MQKHHLDALIAPTGGPPWLTDLVKGDHSTGGCFTTAAVAGYPHFSVPAGYVHGFPVGLSFFGNAFSEHTLIRLAYAFAQATRIRRRPKFLQTADLGSRARKEFLLLRDGRLQEDSFSSPNLRPSHCKRNTMPKVFAFADRGTRNL